MSFHEFAKQVDPSNETIVVIHECRFSSIADHNLRLYTADQYYVQCCNHLAKVYPYHNLYFFSSRRLNSFCSDFQPFWQNNLMRKYIQITPANMELRGFIDDSSCILMVDDYQDMKPTIHAILHTLFTHCGKLPDCRNSKAIILQSTFP